jgi:hypothetical protein
VNQEYPNFARMREYVAPDGVLWHRRGDRVLTGKDLGRRIRVSDLHVVHQYLGELAEVPVTERDEFWAEAQERMRKDVYSDFRGVEFRSDAGQRLLVVVEDC